MEDFFYALALKFTPRIGDITATHLYKYFSTAKAVFEATEQDLLACPFIKKDAISPLLNKEGWQAAEKEMLFVNKYNIHILLFNDKAYPQRLKNIENPPFLLFYKGDLQQLNAHHAISIIGTRTPTNYGIECCQKIVQDLQVFNPVIYSGLAYGIDICAHKKSIQMQLSTIAVLGHGLDIIYPKMHSKYAQQMLENNGGLLTAFTSGSRPSRENFPARNHIVAGISDAIIVIETAYSGGSMITAQIANQYKKDVFAIPGRLNDTFSQGCNALIQKHQATLLKEVYEIAEILGWSNNNNKQTIEQQRQMFATFSADEESIIHCMLGQNQVHLDTLIHKTGFSTSKIAALLLELEFKNQIKVLPGKHFKLL